MSPEIYVVIETMHGCVKINTSLRLVGIFLRPWYFSEIFTMESKSLSDYLPGEIPMQVGFRWSLMDINELQTYKICYLQEQRDFNIKEARDMQNRVKRKQSINYKLTEHGTCVTDNVIGSKLLNNMGVLGIEKINNTDIFNVLCSTGDFCKTQLTTMISKHTRSKLIKLCIGGTQDYIQDFFFTRQRLLRRILYAVHREQHRLHVSLSRYEKNMVDLLLSRLNNQGHETQSSAYQPTFKSLNMYVEVPSNADKNKGQIDSNEEIINHTKISPQLTPVPVRHALESIFAEQSEYLGRDLAAHLSHQVGIVIDNLIQSISNLGPSACFSASAESNPMSDLTFSRKIQENNPAVQQLLLNVCVANKLKMGIQSEIGEKVTTINPYMRLRAFLCHLHMAVTNGSFSELLNVVKLLCSYDSRSVKQSAGTLPVEEINAIDITKVIDDLFKEVYNGSDTYDTLLDAMTGQDVPSSTAISPKACRNTQKLDHVDIQSVNISADDQKVHSVQILGSNAPDISNKSRLEELRSVFSLLGTIILSLEDVRHDERIIEDSELEADNNECKYPFFTPCDDEKAQVWSCGQNSYGELGHGDTVTRNIFTCVNSLLQRSIEEIAAGNEHSLVLTKEGEVLTCGYNDNGQCGHNSTKRAPYFKSMSGLTDTRVTNIYSFNGCEHSLLLTRDGRVATCGFNDYGQLGQGNTNSLIVPKFISSFGKRQVRKISCSYYHTIFACSDLGTQFPMFLYSCGRNDFGQLGTGDIDNRNVPTLVVKFPASAIVLSLGCGQYHSIVIFSTRSKNDLGQLCAFGKNDCGQLGTGKSGNQCLPVFLSSFRCSTIAQHNPKVVKCGYYHNIVLCVEGHLWGFGRNDHGQLGFETNSYDGISYSSRPQLIKGLEGKDVSTVACGSYHTIVACESGLLYVFGRNNHGQLGTGDVDDRAEPFPIVTFINRRISRLSAGFYHTVVLIGGSQIDEPVYLDGKEAGNDDERRQDYYHDALLTHPLVSQMLNLQFSTCPESISSITEENLIEDDHVRINSVSYDRVFENEIPQAKNMYSLVLLIALLAQLSRLCEPHFPKNLHRTESGTSVLSTTGIIAATPEHLTSLYGKIRSSNTPTFPTPKNSKLHVIDPSPGTLRSLLDLLQAFEQADCKMLMNYALLDRILHNGSSKSNFSKFSSHTYMKEVVLDLIQVNLKRFLHSGHAHLIMLGQMFGENKNMMGRMEKLQGMQIVIFAIRDHLLKYFDEITSPSRLNDLYMRTFLQNWDIFFPCLCLRNHFVMSLFPDQDTPISCSIIDSYVSCLQYHQSRNDSKVVFGYPNLRMQAKAMLLSPVLSLVSDDSHMVKSMSVSYDHCSQHPSRIHEGIWHSKQLLYKLILEQLMADNIDALNDGKGMDTFGAGSSQSAHYFQFLTGHLKQITSWVNYQPHWSIPVPAVIETTTNISNRINHILRFILSHEAALRAPRDHCSEIIPSSWRYFLDFVSVTLLHCDELLQQYAEYAFPHPTLENLMKVLKEQTAVGRVLPSILSCLMALVTNSLVASSLYPSLIKLLKSFSELNQYLGQNNKPDWLDENIPAEGDKPHQSIVKKVFKLPWNELLQKELVTIAVDLAIQSSKGDCPFNLEWIATPKESVSKYPDSASTQISLDEWSISKLFESGLDSEVYDKNRFQSTKIGKRILSKTSIKRLRFHSDYALMTHGEIKQFLWNLSAQEPTEMINDAIIFSEWVRSQYRKNDGAYNILLRQRKEQGPVDEHKDLHSERIVAVENAVFAALLKHTPNLALMACFFTSRMKRDQYKTCSSPLPKSLYALWRKVAGVSKENASRKRSLQQQDKDLKPYYCSQQSIIERSQFLLGIANRAFVEGGETVTTGRVYASIGIFGRSCNISSFWKRLRARFYVCIRWKVVTAFVDASSNEIIKFIMDPRIPEDRIGLEMFCTVLTVESTRRIQSCISGMRALREITSWVSLVMSPALQDDVLGGIGRVLLLNPSFPHVQHYAYTQHEEEKPRVSAFPRRTSFKLLSNSAASNQDSNHQHLQLFGSVSLPLAGSVYGQSVSTSRKEIWHHFFSRISDLMYVYLQIEQNMCFTSDQRWFYRLFTRTVSCCSLEVIPSSYNSKWNIFKFLQYILEHLPTNESANSINVNGIIESVRLYLHGLLMQVCTDPINGTKSKESMIPTANDITYNEMIRLQQIEDVEVVKFRDSMTSSKSFKNYIIMDPVRLSDINKGVVAAPGYATLSDSDESVKMGFNGRNNDWSISGWLYLLQVPSVTDTNVPFNSFISSHNIHDDDAMMRFILIRENTMHIFPYVLLSGRYDTNKNETCWFLEAGQGIGNKFDQKNPKIQHLDRLCSKQSLPQKKWTQFTVVSDQHKFRLYLNGLLEAQCTPQARPSKLPNGGLDSTFYIGRAFNHMNASEDGKGNVNYAKQFLSLLSNESDTGREVMTSMNGYVALVSNHLRALSPIHARIVYEKEKEQIGEYFITKQLRARYKSKDGDESANDMVPLKQCRSHKLVELLSILRFSIFTTTNTNVTITKENMNRWIELIWLQLQKGSCWSLMQASIRLLPELLLGASNLRDFTEHSLGLNSHEKSSLHSNYIEEIFHLIGAFTDLRTRRKISESRILTNTDDCRPWCAFCDCVQPRQNKNIAFANEFVRLLDYLAVSAPQNWGSAIQKSALCILEAEGDSITSITKKFGVGYYFGGIIEIDNYCGATVEILSSGRISSIVGHSAKSHGPDMKQSEEVDDLVLIKLRDCPSCAAYSGHKADNYDEPGCLCGITQLPAGLLALGATRAPFVCEFMGLHSPNFIRQVTDSARMELIEFMSCSTNRQVIDQAQVVTSLMKIMTNMARRESFACHISSDPNLMELLLNFALSEEKLLRQNICGITQRVWILRCRLHKVIEQLEGEAEAELEKACQSISMFRTTTYSRKSRNPDALPIVDKNDSVHVNKDFRISESNIKGSFFTSQHDVYYDEERHDPSRSNSSSTKNEVEDEYEHEQYLSVYGLDHGSSSSDMSDSSETQEQDDTEWLNYDSGLDLDEIESGKVTNEASICEDDPYHLKKSIDELKMMGFPQSWCLLALQETGEDIVTASTWLVDNLENLIGSQAELDKNKFQELKVKCCAYSDEEDDPVEDEVQERSDISSQNIRSQERNTEGARIEEETARKIFAETYFPLHDGGYYHNIRDQYVQTWKKAPSTIRGTRQTSTDVPPHTSNVLTDARPGISSMDATAMYIHTCTEVKAFQERVDEIMDLGILLQLLVDHELAQTIIMSRNIVANILSAKKMGRMPILQEASYSAFFEYIKLVFWRGDQFILIQESECSDRTTKRSRLYMKEVVKISLKSFMRLNPEEFTDSLVMFILRELESACSNDRYKSILWTNRPLHRSDSAVVQEPGIEIITFVFEWMLHENESRAICRGVFNLCNELGENLYKSTNLAIRFICNHICSHSLNYLLRRGEKFPERLIIQSPVLLKAAHARYTREWMQHRFFFSNYLLSYVDLLHVLCKINHTIFELLSTHQPASKKSDRPLAFQTRNISLIKYKVSQDATTVAYRGQHVWNTIVAVESYTTGCHHWSFRIDKLPSCYLFLGVCSDKSNTYSFLGSDNESWGLMGDGGLYHRHNRVQTCSSKLSEGDIIECKLDLEFGTLLYTKNGTEMGCFDNIIGRVAPAVSFYSRSQKVSLLASKPSESPNPFSDIPVLMTHNPTGEIDGTIRDCVWACKWMEWFLADLDDSASDAAPSLPNNIAHYAYDMYQEWIKEKTYCLATRTGDLLWVDISEQHGASMQPTKRVTTSRGPGTIVGTSYDRIWVRLDDEDGIWFFHSSKMIPIDDPAVNQFPETGGNSASKYNLNQESEVLMKNDQYKTSPEMLGSDIGHKMSPMLSREEFDEYCRSSAVLPHLRFDLSQHLIDFANGYSTESRDGNPWNITPAQFRTMVSLQDSKSLYFKLNNIPIESLLIHFAILRAFNRLMASVLPFFDLSWYTFNLNSNDLSCQLFSQSRRLLFTYIKDKMMESLLARTALSPNRTEDDLDFPDDIPQITINRPRAAAARASYMNYLHRRSKEPAAKATIFVKPRWLFDSLFGQAFEAIHYLSFDQLRTVYNHPMDDGQIRSFKVNFDGEGADDYGGPYREFFSQFFVELQSLADTGDEDARCFLPFLMPCPNWRNGTGSNREKFILNTREMRICHREACLMKHRLHEKDTRREWHSIHLYEAFSFPICDMERNLNDSSYAVDEATNPNYGSSVRNMKRSCSCHVQEKFELLGDMFYFIGQMFGICLRTKICAHMDLATCIWQSLLSVHEEENDDFTWNNQRSKSDKETLQMLQEIDSVSYSLLIQLQAICAEVAQTDISDQRRVMLFQNLDAMDLTYVTHLSDGVLVELCTDGSNRAVTLDNLAEYIAKCLRARRRENVQIISIIKQGMASVVPFAALSLYTSDELVRRFCGDEHMNIEILKENTDYDEGICDQDECIQRFWRVLSDFTEQDKRMFLQFVWARSHLPAGTSRFHQKFKIQKSPGLDTEHSNVVISVPGDPMTTRAISRAVDNDLIQQTSAETLLQSQLQIDRSCATATAEGGSTSMETKMISEKYEDSKLPRSHTCFFALQLPRYSNDEICRKQLLYAIHNCVEMDGDFRPADSESSSWKELDTESPSTSIMSSQTSQLSEVGRNVFLS